MKKLIGGAGFNHLIEGRHGYVLYNVNDRYIGRSVENYGEWSPAETALFARFCRPGDYVVDVGANIGTHTLAFARLVGERGRVFAFEPQRMVAQVLAANAALNSLTNGPYLPSGGRCGRRNALAPRHRLLAREELRRRLPGGAGLRRE